MLYNKILMMCGSLIMISSNVVGMDTLILIPVSRAAIRPKAQLEAIEKKKKFKQQRLSKYKECLPQIKMLFDKNTAMRGTLQAFVSQINGYDTSQISGVRELGLDTALANCIAGIDKHIIVCKAILEPKGVSLDKKLLITGLHQIAERSL